MSETSAAGGQEGTAAGKVIVIVVSSLSAIMVLMGLIYATGASGRHMTALLAADCEPTLFISGLPCTTQAMMVSQYDAMETPTSRQLDADTAAYTASEEGNLPAAKAALTAEVGAEQAFGSNLAAVTFTPQNRATALALITRAESNGNGVPLAAVTFTPQITVIADALIRANQALVAVTAEQAQSSSLTKLRSFNARVQAANAIVQTELKRLHAAVEVPLAGAQGS
jgi:hypothetical protein